MYVGEFMINRLKNHRVDYYVVFRKMILVFRIRFEVILIL